MTTGLAERDALGCDPATYLRVHRAIDESAADRLLDEREHEVRRRTREVVAHQVAPRAAEADRTHTFVHESYQALAGAGLAGLLFPSHLGGSADTHVAYAAAMEEITAGCAATSLVYMTQTHTAYPIMTAGSEDLAGRYVPGLLDGSAYGSLAISEPAAGSDVAALTTRAVPRHADTNDDADVVGYTLHGSKTFITTGDRSDVIVCFCTVDPSRGRDGVTAVVVDAGSAGLDRGRPLDKMGMHGSTTAELFLSGVEVPAANRLGPEGGGWQVVMDSVVKSRISAAAQGVGLARSAYAETLHALHRAHGARLPAEASFALAEMRGEILRGRLLLLGVAREVDRAQRPSPGQIGVMKQSCTDLGWRTAVEAARVLGPYGDLADVGVERALRDAKVTQIYDGTNEVQRLLIGRDTARSLEEMS